MVNEPPKELNVGGVPVGSVYSRPQLYSTAVIITGVDKKGNLTRRGITGILTSSRGEVGQRESDLQARSGQWQGGTRLSRRPGVLRPSIGAVDDNRPTIQIISTRIGSGPRALGIFDQFILMHVQELDAEKSFVVETFGNPHFFSAGRFVRKYSFSGRLRTTPVNWISTRPEYRVPQSVLFRRFYDTYLRMTEQVRTGRFTRITVDGDVYDGYVTTLNLARASDPETVADFAFSFLGVRRAHSELENDAAQLLDAQFKVMSVEEQSTFNDTVAQAEIVDAVGTLELWLKKAGQEEAVQTLNFGEATFSEMDDKRTDTIVELVAVGTPQVLRVAVAKGVKGVGLQFLDRQANVNGTLATVAPTKGSPGQRLQVQISNYAELYKSFAGENPSAKEVSGEVSFSISSDTATPVTLTYQMRLLGTAAFSVKRVSVEYLTGSRFKAGPVEVGVAAILPAAPTGPTGVLLSGNRATAKFTLFLEGGNGKPLPDSALSDVANAVTIGTVSSKPALGDQYLIAEDPVSCSATFNVTTVARSATPSAIEVTGDFVYKIGEKDLGTKDSVFGFADRLRVEVPMLVTLKGYTEKTKKPVNVISGLVTASSQSLVIESAVSYPEPGSDTVARIVIQIKTEKKVSVDFFTSWTLAFLWTNPPPGLESKLIMWPSFSRGVSSRLISIDNRKFSYDAKITLQEAGVLITIGVQKGFESSDPTLYRDSVPDQVSLYKVGLRTNTVTVVRQ